MRVKDTLTDIKRNSSDRVTEFGLSNDLCYVTPQETAAGKAYGGTPSSLFLFRP